MHVYLARIRSNGEKTFSPCIDRLCNFHFLADVAADESRPNSSESSRILLVPRPQTAPKRVVCEAQDWVLEFARLNR
jgi:hypothetical protein